MYNNILSNLLQDIYRAYDKKKIINIEVESIIRQRNRPPHLQAGYLKLNAL